MELVLLLGALTAGLYVGSKGLMFAGRLTGKAIKGSIGLVSRKIKKPNLSSLVYGGADEINNRAAKISFAVKDAAILNKERCLVTYEHTRDAIVGAAQSIDAEAKKRIRQQSMKQVEDSPAVDPRLVHDVN